MLNIKQKNNLLKFIIFLFLLLSCFYIGYKVGKYAAFRDIKQHIEKKN
jgi:hypothetical protein